MVKVVLQYLLLSLPGSHIPSHFMLDRHTGKFFSCLSGRPGSYAVTRVHVSHLIIFLLQVISCTRAVVRLPPSPPCHHRCSKLAFVHTEKYPCIIHQCDGSQTGSKCLVLSVLMLCCRLNIQPSVLDRILLADRVFSFRIFGSFIQS